MAILSVCTLPAVARKRRPYLHRQRWRRENRVQVGRQSLCLDWTDHDHVQLFGKRQDPRVTCEGDKTDFAIADDGALIGPPDGMLARLTKEK